MKRFSIVLLICSLASAAVIAQVVDFNQVGRATQVMQVPGLFIAHPTLPLYSTMMIENLATGQIIQVTITGRVPAATARIADLSPAAWTALGLTPATDIRIFSPVPPPLIIAAPPLTEPEPVMIAEPPPPPVVITEPLPEPEPVMIAEPPPPPVVITEPLPEPEPVIIAEPPPTPPVVITEPLPEPEPVVIAEPPPPPPPVVIAEPPLPPPPPVIVVEPPVIIIEAPPPVIIVETPPPVIIVEPAPVIIAEPPPPPAVIAEPPTPPVTIAEPPPQVAIVGQPPLATADQPFPPPATDPMMVQGILGTGGRRYYFIYPEILERLIALEIWQIAQGLRELAPEPSPVPTFPIDPELLERILQLETRQDLLEDQLLALTPEPLPPPPTLPPIVFLQPPPVQPAPPPPTVFVPYTPPAPIQWPHVIPGLPNPHSGMVHRLQVGAFSSLESAVTLSNSMANAGFFVIHELHQGMFRVVALGVPASMVYPAIHRLASLGVTQVWVQ